MEIKLLHIYCQEQWHDDVYIVGNKIALSALRDAIDRVIDGHVGLALVTTNDGEGYVVNIFDIETGIWKNRAVPYTKDIAEEKSPNAIWPWNIKNKEGQNE